MPSEVGGAVTRVQEEMGSHVSRRKWRNAYLVPGLGSWGW